MYRMLKRVHHIVCFMIKKRITGVYDFGIGLNNDYNLSSMLYRIVVIF